MHEAKQRGFRPIEPGAIVRYKGRLGVVLRMNENGASGGRVRLLCDCGTISVMRWEVTIPRREMRPFQPMRLRLPYGVWMETDGTKVLFSRDYCPLWRISPTGDVMFEDPWRQIDFEKQEWFFDDTCPPWRSSRKAHELEQRLRDLRVSGTPRLMGVLDILVRGRAKRVPEAVHLMMSPDVR